jgi:hypothetical protein
MPKTDQQKFIGAHGKALKMCHEELGLDGKFVPMKKTGKGQGKKLYECVQEKIFMKSTH